MPNQLTFAPPPTFATSQQQQHTSFTTANRPLNVARFSIDLPNPLVTSLDVRKTIVKTFITHLLYSRGQVAAIITSEALRMAKEAEVGGKGGALHVHVDKKARVGGRKREDDKGDKVDKEKDR